MIEDPRPLILHVIHHLVTGGMENGLVNLIDGLPADEFRHAIACIEDSSEFRQRLRRQDVEVIAMRRSHVGVWRMRRNLFRLCRRLGPTIVHTRNLSGLDALVPARLAGVRHCVHSEHGWDVGDLVGAKRRPAWLRKVHAPFVSRYITVSRHLERYLIERVGIVPSRITQIYNGVDVDRFAPARTKPTELLPPTLRGDDLFVVGTVGRVQAVKDQQTLVQAFAEMIRMRPALRRRARIALVGNGPLLGQLRDEAAALGIAEISWLPGARTDVPDLLRLFDVFVLPSLNEGISNTILEAMASGLPILATEVGGNIEIVEAEQSGRLFAPGDVPGLAALLTAYADDPALRASHASAARSNAVRLFSLPTMIDRYRAVYASLLATRTDASRTAMSRPGAAARMRKDA